MVANDSNVKAGTPVEVEVTQLHFHAVSEQHSFKGRLFPGELHIVMTVKKGKTETYVRITCYSVFGIFLKYPNDIHKELNDVMSVIYENVPKKEIDEEYANNLKQKLDLNKLLPEIKDYFTRDGSLTMPLCTETVPWHVFRNPVRITEE